MNQTSPSGEKPDATEPTTGEVACFETGIKFGSLYHQFAGSPVSPASVDSIARAMEDAIENQPHCESVTVAVDTDALQAELDESSADYTELTGRFLDVEIVVGYEGHTVTAQMAMEDGYPLMRVVDVSSEEGRDTDHGR
ncbi:hypothetical protein Halru_2601 [Halovivax ruber XH-70]|uniref:Dihydroneopterin aldolase n=1 Tax=Halovivax ruber (strain DSM 18193 / JCM 13892 / XH-70) TaxID=797302 RepID=L0IGS2_HALRX|nr:dihydroneopterin aldolase family protein [Halovivax ruber]AGB17182.1 hypothetical protein Halru_2601 [Halovivax ruber XH-70]